MAIESLKPPEDQRVSLEDTHMGSAIVIWNQSNVAALRQIDWETGCSVIYQEAVMWIWSLKRRRFGKR
jgi:hypothetical protein